MSIIVTPTLNATETFQVATPFSYSFTYSEAITAVDTPAYYFGTSVFTGNSVNIRVRVNENGEATGTGLVYTVRNMTPVTDVLQCVLPLASGFFSLNPESYVTFGGPTRLYLENKVDTGQKLATFAGAGTFAYGSDNETFDSLTYTVLNGAPVSSFRIKLKRAANRTAPIQCVINSNVMSVTAIYGGLTGGGQVTVGMVYPVQTGLLRAFTVTSYLTGTNGVFGGIGTYGIAPNDAGAALTVSSNTYLNTNEVAGSGDVVLSNSMTPADGTAQFSIYVAFGYVPPGE